MQTLHSGLFLREEALRHGIELLMVAQRDMSRTADGPLEELDLGRAHQRALYFIGQEPGLTVSVLLSRLDITKQSLSRVLKTLVARGLVSQVQGPTDARQKLLRLTDEGRRVEKQLFERQRDRLMQAYRTAGADAVAGFWQVLALLVDAPDRTRLMARFDPAR